MPTIVHFEIPADDIERTMNFYREIFGWKFEKCAGPMDYWLITTTNEQGENAMMGGVIKRQHPQHTIINYIDVPSADEYAKKIEALGGKILVTKTLVPETGYFVICMDTEKNVFAIWEQICNKAKQ
ncbi:MAG: VOC family protein [Candidatus Magnetoovum sp. WYHC-5]|nr:VOC family protein [Candidatus Magnetoovum sp. WYHC-5]